jgi:TolA-binding protein
MQQVARAAASEHAHYLRPFARLMLALASLREKNTDVAREQLQNLAMEFPENPLFAKELAKVKPVMTRVAP